jgi:hypothetical protein
LFGYQLLIIGAQHFNAFTLGSRLLNYAHRDPLEPQITLALEDVDIIILPHWIYYFPEPSILLADLWKALKANGRIIITGYQNVSLLGWQRLRHESVVKNLPQQAHATAQLTCLLRQQQFSICKTEKYGPSGIGQRTLADKDLTRASYFGCCTMIEAIKDLATIKSIQTQWSKPCSKVTQSVVSPFIINDALQVKPHES